MYFTEKKKIKLKFVINLIINKKSDKKWLFMLN